MNEGFFPVFDARIVDAEQMMHAAVAGSQLERPQQVVSRDVQLAAPVIDGGQTDVGLDLIGRCPQRFQRGGFVAVSKWLRLSGKGLRGQRLAAGRARQREQQSEPDPFVHTVPAAATARRFSW